MNSRTNAREVSFEDIISITEASQLLKLKVSTIYALTSARSIPHFKRGNRLYFLRSELLAWVLAGRRNVIDPGGYL